MNNSYITIIKEKRTALSRKRIPLNQNGCTANFRIGVPFGQNLQEEVQEFVNLTITEHMGKAYSEWKLNQDKEPVSEIEKKYQELLETLSPEQEEVITEYCNAIFSSGADTEEFFYRLGLKNGLNLKNTVKSVLEMIS